MGNPISSFAIGIPTYNRWDLLQPALKNYVKEFPDHEILIFDNGRQDIPDKIDGKWIQVIKNSPYGENIGVAAAWNILCTEIFKKYPYALILNDDIYLGQGGDFVEDFLMLGSPADLYVTPKDWCAFILPEKTWKLVGPFDAKFYPAYYEDSDYLYRMKLMGLRVDRNPMLIPYVYRECSTKDADPDQFYDAGYLSRKHYKEKWGGLPGQEQYKRPFNKKR